MKCVHVTVVGKYRLDEMEAPMQWRSSRLPSSPRQPRLTEPASAAHWILSFTRSLIFSLYYQFFVFIFWTETKMPRMLLFHYYMAEHTPCQIVGCILNGLIPAGSEILQGPLVPLPFWCSPWSAWWTWRRQRLLLLATLPFVFPHPSAAPAKGLVFFGKWNVGWTLFDRLAIPTYVTDCWINNNLVKQKVEAKEKKNTY